MEETKSTPRILVAEDDPDLRAICRLVLESEGYKIELAANGHEAYEQLVAEGVDVVLLDIMMPVMDGLTVCRLLKRDPRTRDMPVIMMSASDSLRVQSERCCADAVLAKPFDIDTLVTLVGQFAGGVAGV